MEDSDQIGSLTDRPPFFLREARVDPPALRIARGGKNQRVEAKVMQVLLALAREPGRVVSRQELENEIWPGRIVTENSVTNTVAKLRKALGDNPRKPRVIETIAKRGYRLQIDPVPTDGNVAPGTPRVTEKFGSLRRRPLLLFVPLIAAAFVAAVFTWRSADEPVMTRPGEDAGASIAVIPFDVLSEDSSQDYFAEGVTLDLITELSRLPGLLVIAPGSVFGYRDVEADDRAIASELGVHYLIRGAVQRMADQVRINARLIEASSGRTLWGKRFTGDTAKLFEIQDEVVEGIATALRTRLAAPVVPLARSGATRSIAAYDEFLRGQDRYGRRTPEDNRIARAHFEQAIALDPGFARAYAGLALSWSRLGIDGWTSDPEEALSRAATLADKAASIDATVPQIHFVRAQVALFRGRHDRAAEAAATAIELDPNYADAYALLAWILHYAGRPDQARPALSEALRRNPASSASYGEIAGEIDFATGQYRAAVREFEAALERNPAHARARLWLAATRIKLGQEEDAAWEVQELLAINPDFSLSRLLLAFPLKDPYQRDALTGALAELGLPE